MISIFELERKTKGVDRSVVRDRSVINGLLPGLRAVAAIAIHRIFTPREVMLGVPHLATLHGFKMKVVADS